MAKRYTSAKPMRRWLVTMRYTLEEEFEVEAESEEAAESAARDALEFSPHAGLVDWEQIGFAKEVE